MPVRDFPQDEAIAVIGALTQADADLGPGRDLFFEIESASGQTSKGLVVARTDDEITLADVTTPGNDHNTVSLSDVSSVCVRSYT